ncbi:rhomboid family intramembrane serine protease [Echinicola sp. 20G]|uniref:rhomboid family intramembrane serine protease n=1 Tax=Echinicola sp. 20G TaxID=2781961 RepID=UPI00191099B7|nr:rhomboid family intramembrane serine protease [Echinicola sp. 20G]
MAFGLPPRYEEYYRYQDIEDTHFLVLTYESAKQLGWNIVQVGEDSLRIYTKYSLSSWSEEITVSIRKGRAYIKSECMGHQWMDWGKNSRNVKHLIQKIEKNQKAIDAEELGMRFDQLKEDFTQEEIPNPKEKMSSVLSFFIPVKDYFVTPIILHLNVLIFLIMVLSGVNIFLPESKDLLDWGANYRPMTLEGEWWRLLSSCFVHIGVLHLLLNMYALMYIGLMLEPYLGKTRLLAAYLLAGVAGSVASLWWNELVISAGASGAIFGLYGVFIALLTTNLIHKSTRKTLMASILIFVVYNLLNGLKPESGIDNAAHIGGLLAGLAIGYGFVPSIRNNGNIKLKHLTIASISFLLFISSYIVYASIPNDIGNYDKKMERFASLESMALEFYSMPETTPKDELLTELKDRGIYYWNENLQLLDSMEQMDLPMVLAMRNGKLKTYCQLRIKSYELIYKAIEEDTDQYRNEITKCNQQIDRIISDLTEGLE